MGKKIWYSTPLKFFWNDVYKKQKQYSPSLTDHQVFSIIKYNLVNAPLTVGENRESRELMISGWELWAQDCTKELLHIFFLEKKLRDFLEIMPLSDLDGIKKHIYENGEKKTTTYLKIDSRVNCVVYSFGLHIPYESDGCAFSLSIFEDETLELYFSKGTNNGRLSDKMFKKLNKKNDDKSITMSKMFRLAINTLAYMKCFPECVSEGVPKITKEKNEKRSNKNVTFSVSKRITDIEKTKQSKIPHFRKGHFRALNSDYFTNKKGQIVYVAEAMVGGKAKTVDTSPRLQKFENSKTNIGS